MSREGPVVYFFPHSSLLLHKFPSLRFLSCVIATIRGFVFFVSDTTVLYNICRCSVFRLFYSKWPSFFLFLRNVHSSIEILKLKFLEHSDPPSQHFFVHKAFSRSFLRRRKVVLCHLAEWHILPGKSPSMSLLIA